MQFTVKIQRLSTRTDGIGSVSQRNEVPVCVAVGVRAKPHKAVSRGVLRDGHVEQLHSVHCTTHVTVLQHERESVDKGNDGGLSITCDFVLRNIVDLRVPAGSPSRGGDVTIYV